MKMKWMSLVVLMAGIVAAHGASAKSSAMASPHAAPHGMMGAGKKSVMSGKMTASATSASVSGPIKGAVTGKTFVIGRRGGPVTVDASKARIRVNGKFGSLSALKGGVMVTAKGEIKGSTLMATEVNASPRGGGAMKKK